MMRVAVGSGFMLVVAYGTRCNCSRFSPSKSIPPALNVKSREVARVIFRWPRLQHLMPASAQLLQKASDGHRGGGTFAAWPFEAAFGVVWGCSEGNRPLPSLALNLACGQVEASIEEYKAWPY